MAERSLLREEIGNLLGHAKDAVEGVKDWTISTLGPTQVGKTVLISGLYAQYYFGMENEKPIGIESIKDDLHVMLRGIAKGLKDRPITVPPPTTEIRNAELKFLVKPKDQILQKIIRLQDHAGEHLKPDHPLRQETLERLQESDSFMVLLDSGQVLREDKVEASEMMELNIIKSLIRSISGGLYEKDIVPISVVLSKSDTAIGREAELVNKAVKLFDGLSQELKKCVFCLAPVSVIKNVKSDDDPYFILSPHNTEVPFLFCIASIVYRNAKILELEAEIVESQRKEILSASTHGLGFFQRLAASIVRPIEGRRLGLKAKRYVSLSSYDLKLADAALNIINLNKNVTFLRDGVVYNRASEALGII